MSEEWCREQLANLEIEDLRESTLQEILKEITLPHETNDFSSSFLQSPAVFDCLESDKEQVTIACDILEICMSHLRIGDSVNKYSNLLERALLHSSSGVKSLAIKELARVVTHCPTVVLDVTLILALIKCLCEDVGASVILVLSQTISVFLDNKSVMEKLVETVTRDTVTRCRTYEIAVNVAKGSPAQLNIVQFFLEQIVLDLSNNDVLMQLNVLELLSNLATVPHGFSYLEEKGVLARITKDAEKVSENRFAVMLIPGYMKFFGSISQLHPSKVFQSSNMIHLLLNCFFEMDAYLLPIAFDTLGHLCKTFDGKLLMHETYHVNFEAALAEIGKTLRNLATETKIRALQCLEYLFTVSPEERVNNRVCDLLEGWYKILSGGQQNLEFIQEFAKNPFGEIKAAAFELLFNIIQFSWGQEYFVRTLGFVEQLMNRDEYCSTDIKHAKYKIIKILSTSELFDRVTQKLLKEYVIEGPFYVQGVMEVAIENVS